MGDFAQWTAPKGKPCVVPLVDDYGWRSEAGAAGSQKTGAMAPSRVPGSLLDPGNEVRPGIRVLVRLMFMGFVLLLIFDLGRAALKGLTSPGTPATSTVARPSTTVRGLRAVEDSSHPERARTDFHAHDTVTFCFEYEDGRKSEQLHAQAHSFLYGKLRSEVNLPAVEGSGTAFFTLPPPTEGWSPGKVDVEIIVNHSAGTTASFRVSR